MIALQKERQSIAAAFLDPAREANLIDLFREAANGALKTKAVKDRLFASSRWSAAKNQLKKETRGKCAFCEAPTEAVYYGDIEHVRPKAEYWWLAYCYENYVYSCRICNGKKGEKHSFSGTRLTAPQVARNMTDSQLLAIAKLVCPEPSDAIAASALVASFASEESHLPNPYEIDPTTLFKWEADAVLREVRIAARPSIQGAGHAITAVTKIVGLNRPELLIARWRTYDQLRQLRDFANIANGELRESILGLIRTMTAHDAPFSAMSGYFAHEEWALI